MYITKTMFENNIKLNIEIEGFNKFNKNLFQLNKLEINRSFDSHFNNPKYRNNEYENVAILNFNDLKQTIYFEILNKIIKILKFNNLNYHFDTLWLQNSNSTFSDSKINELPFIPHIDKRRCLKVMIYLNNINKDAGPINLTKTNPANFEKIRKNLKHDYQLKKENVISTIPIEKYIPCDGDFGTSIFFDTNTPHFAGQIREKEAFRKILRFTFLKPKNKLNKIKNFFEKVFN